MTTYRERLWPAPWLYIATALIIPATLLVFVPINFTVGVVVAIVFYLGITAALVFGSATIEVTETELIAGRARLPLAVIGDVSSYTAEEATLERGRRLDARAWLLLRGWITPVVKIEVRDAEDPTPYWLVSSRHPEAIAAAIAQATQN